MAEGGGLLNRYTGKTVSGVRIPLSPPVFIGKSEDDSRIDSRNSTPSCPDLTRIVTAWTKLPAPLKAAVLAIVNSAEGQS